MKTLKTAFLNQIKFDDADIINPDDFIPAGSSNPHKVRPFLFHDAGFTIGIVFADCVQDALDELADSGKIDFFKIDVRDKHARADYLIQGVVTPGYDATCPEFVDEAGNKFWWQEGREPSFLGNAGEPFDIENLGIEELVNPPFSFVALYNQHTA